MGYSTDFYGEIEITPALNQEEIDFLTRFCRSRRMTRKSGPYTTGETEYSNDSFMREREDSDIIDYNHPPKGQPDLWCNWEPSEDGSCIHWNGSEKSYNMDEWITYLIEHFIGDNPRAKNVLPFLQSHKCNGVVDAYGEDHGDIWRIVVTDNNVRSETGAVMFSYEGE